MSNHRSIKSILLSFRQRSMAKLRKEEKAMQRNVSFEINRARIKAKVESDRDYLARATLVFLTGLLLVVFGMAYVIGAILYG